MSTGTDVRKVTSRPSTAGGGGRRGLRTAGSLLNGPVGSIAIALTVVLVIGLVWVGPSYLSASNLIIVGTYVAVPLLVATAVSFSLLAGVVDLSIGSMAGFSGAVFASLVSTGWDPWAAAGVSLVLCAVAGCVNAVAIVGFGADPLATTLGMLTALRGLVRVIAGPTPPPAFVPGLFDFTNRTVGPFPLILLCVVALVVLCAVIVTRTRLGRHVRAVGGDELAARRAGISVSRIRVGALLVAALGAGLGGILWVGQLGSASNTLGTGLEFQVYAAMMIGGFSIIRGGIGNPVGAMLGLLVVAGITNILNVNFIDPDYLDLVLGMLLLAAVLLDRFRGGDEFE